MKMTRTLSTLLGAAAVGLASLTWASPAQAVATAPPNPVTNLTVSIDPSIPWNLRLDWTDNTPAATDPNAETFVEVERCKGVGCTDWANVFLGWTPGWDMTWFLDKEMSKTDNTTYSYRVRGRNDAGMSEWSNVASGTTQWRAPASPVNFAAAYVGANTAGLNGDSMLTWADVASTEFGYQINRCEPINCLATKVSFDIPANSTSYRDTTTIDGKEYSYNIAALGGSGFHGYGQTITHVAGAGLAAPTRVAARLVTNGIQLSWRNSVRKPIQIWRCDTLVCVDGISGRYLQPLFTSKTTVPAGTTSWTDRFTRQAGTPYFYRIQVVTATAVSQPVYVRITG